MSRFENLPHRKIRTQESKEKKIKEVCDLYFPVLLIRLEGDTEKANQLIKDLYKILVLKNFDASIY